MIYYVAMATLGSVLGVAFTQWVSAEGARKGMEGKKSRRTAYVERQVKTHGGLAIGFAALMPPPFPFTPFIIVAGAMQYPLRKMLLIVGVCRAVRFTTEGILALIYGRRIIAMAQSPWLQHLIIGLVVISIAGSAWSIYNWFRKSRRS
jgi:membrane protein YqaA with SNARE-associated domain